MKIVNLSTIKASKIKNISVYLFEITNILWIGRLQVLKSIYDSVEKKLNISQKEMKYGK
jgi:uncharacterized protein YfkK (UPF0435 family)